MLMRFLKKRGRFGRAAALLLLLPSGCTGLLPKRSEISLTPFATFDAAHASFEKVRLGTTSAKDLAALGFDPDSASNVRQLTHLDVLAIFVPESGVPLSTLPATIQHCIAVETRCVGYALNPRTLNRDRDGDAFLDFFDFRRRTRITGWEANALFVLVDGVVVYKLWSGTPRVEKTELTVNPLGPVQDLGSILNQVLPSINY